MIELMRIQNPNAIRLPTIRRLLTKAVESHAFVKNVEEALLELEYWAMQRYAALFIVRENGTWVSFGFVQWGESAFSPFATVVHVYNEGSREALKMLQRAMVAFARIGGYDQGLTLDSNGKAKGFPVLFREGGTAEPVGTAYLFTFYGDSDDGRQQLDHENQGSDPEGVHPATGTAG